MASRIIAGSPRLSSTTAHAAASPTLSPATDKTLSVAQMLVLSTAAQRPDHMVMPLPATLRLRGGGQTRLLATLVKAALIEEVPVSDDALCWRHDADDQRIGLRVTEAGLAVVQIPSQRAAAAPTQAATVEEPAPSSTPAPVTVTMPAQPHHPGGKLGQVLSAVSDSSDATLAELVGMTGWQAHTARAALTGLRRRGFIVQLSERQGRKAYRLDTAG
jgi:hypothetical protein